jgi:hypothetical protein
MRVRTSLHAKRALALAGRVVACSMLVGIGLTLAGSSAWGSPSAPPEMTTTTVTCSPNPAAVGEPVTCVANVSVANVSAQGGEPPVSIESAMSYVPTGSVSFTGFGGVAMGSVPLVGGAASVTVTTQATGGPLPVGSDVVTADYTSASGTGFEASSGNTTEVVNPVTSPVTSPTSPPTATSPTSTSTSTSTSTTPTTTIPPTTTESSSGTTTTTTVSEGPKPVRLVTGPGAAPASSDPLEWSGVALVGLGLAGLAWSLFELLRGRRGRHV